MFNLMHLYLERPIYGYLKNSKTVKIKGMKLWKVINVEN